MKFKVHRLEINMESNPETLEGCLNGQEGDVVAIIPNYARTSLFQIYGLTRKIDFVLIIEKIG